LLSRLKSGTMLLADRGYDADWIRALAATRGVWANIPPRCNRNEPICFSPYLYRARNLVERFFNKIKQCRRAATRYDKLAANYLAFIQLASIKLWLRVNESTPSLVAGQMLLAPVPDPLWWSVGDPHPDSDETSLELSFRAGAPTDGAPFGVGQHILGRYR